MFQSSVHFPLRGVVAEVGHQTYTEGVCSLPTLNDAQVASGLCQALPEAQAAVILSKRVSLKVTCQERKQSQKVRNVVYSVFRHFELVNYNMKAKAKERLCYLCHQTHEASSNGPQSFAKFLLFPI